MKIDRGYLLSLAPRPCPSGLAAFDEAFPDGLAVEGEPDEATLEKLTRLDLAWFGETLPARSRAAYYRALAEPLAAYYRALAEPRAAYDRAVAEAEAAYDRAVAESRAVAEAWAAYRRAVAEARAAYDRAVAEAGAAYDRAVARALWRIVASMEVSS